MSSSSRGINDIVAHVATVFGKRHSSQSLLLQGTVAGIQINEKPSLAERGTAQLTAGTRADDARKWR
jgi:hypothetical protein